MFGIRNIGVISSIDELKKSQELPADAVQFRESNKISDIFYDGLMIGGPLIIGAIALSIYRYEFVEENLHFTALTWITLAVTVGLLLASTYVHEIIHALFYPRDSVKTICSLPEEGAHLLYCDAKVSKWRFILICLAPSICLGIFPLLIWAILANLIPMPFNFAIVAFSIVSLFSSIGDYANVFNCLRQVPNKAKVFNYGIHSYWIK